MNNALEMVVVVKNAYRQPSHLHHKQNQKKIKIHTKKKERRHTPCSRPKWKTILQFLI